MKYNAKIYTKESKEGKQYLYCDLEKEDGVFTFAFMPKFLNKKQYRYLMMLVNGGKNETSK